MAKVNIGCYSIDADDLATLQEMESKDMFTDAGLTARGIPFIVNPDDRMGWTFVRDNTVLGKGETADPLDERFNWKWARGIDKAITNLIFAGRKIKYSPNPEVLKVANMFVQNRDGLKNVNAMAYASVPELLTWYQNMYANRMHITLAESFRIWKQNKAKDPLGIRGGVSNVRDATGIFADVDPMIEFKKEIYEQVISPKQLPADSPIPKLLDDIDKMNHEILLEAKNNYLINQEMYDNIVKKSEGSVYLPRVWDAEENQVQMKLLGTKDSDFDQMLNDAITSAQGQSLETSYADLLRKKGVKNPEQVAARLSNEVITRLRKRMTDPTYETVSNLMSFRKNYDIEGMVDDILEEIKTDESDLWLSQVVPDEVYDTLQSGFHSNPKSDDPRPKFFKKKATGRALEDKAAVGASYFKSRIDMDMNTPLHKDGEVVKDKDGNIVRLKDFYEKDVTGLWGFYYDDLSARIALAKHGIDTIHRGSSFHNLLEHVRDSGATNEEITAIEQFYRVLTGAAGEEYQSKWWNTARTVTRALSHATILGQTGATALADIGLLAARMGFRQAIISLRHSFGRRISRMSPKTRQEVVAELSIFSGLGNDADAPQFMRGMGDPNDVPVGVSKKTEAKAGAMSNMIHRLSGLTNVSQILRRAALWGFTDMLYREGPKGFNRLMKQKMKMSDEDILLIQQEMETHGEFKKNWGRFKTNRLVRLNIDKWSPEAQFKFGIAIRNFTFDVVFEPSATGRPYHAEKPSGRFMWGLMRHVLGTGEQFASYGRDAWQITNEQGRAEWLARGQRSSVAQGLTGLTGYGLVSGLAIHYVKSKLASLGREDPDDYFDKRYGDSWAVRIAKGLSYNSAAGFPLYIYEKVSRPDEIERMFTSPNLAFPTSTGWALFTMLNAALSEDHNMSYGQWRRTLRAVPYNNSYIGNWLSNWIAGELAE